MTKDYQEDIKKWFNQTYSQRGELYLRPAIAYELFVEILQAKKSDKLLDIACGLGRLLSVFEKEVSELHGIDISEVAVEKAQSIIPQAKIICANAEELPFPDQYFDFITCIGSLERMLDLNKVLSEQKRVANDVAKFCFMVRNSHTISWLVKSFLGIQNKKGHQGAKSLEEWKSIFKQAGFEIVNIFPDPWPINRFYWWLSLAGKIPLPFKKIRKPIVDLKYAYEFIFVLKKATDV